MVTFIIVAALVIAAVIIYKLTSSKNNVKEESIAQVIEEITIKPEVEVVDEPVIKVKKTITKKPAAKKPVAKTSAKKAVKKSK